MPHKGVWSKGVNVGFKQGRDMVKSVLQKYNHADQSLIKFSPLASRVFWAADDLFHSNSHSHR